MNILLQINHINVRSQLTYAVEWMIKIDFPDNWPDLIIEIKNFIDSDDEMMILTALENLKPICRIYEFEYKTKRKQLEEIVDNIFPRLEEIISQIEQNTSVKAFDICSFPNTAPRRGRGLKNFVDSKNPAPLLFYSTHKKQ